jgi:hypothetical protein
MEDTTLNNYSQTEVGQENLIAADKLQTTFGPEYYKEKKIIEITNKDKNVCIIGRIIDVYNSTLIIDDGSGKITVFINTVKNPNIIKGLKINDIIRVFGIVSGKEDDIIINADLVQNFNGFDENLYRRILEIEKKVEKYV